MSRNRWLERKRFISTVSQKSAKGKVGQAVGKASKELPGRAEPVCYAASGSMGTSS
jgi:hypothetical protein